MGRSRGISGAVLVGLAILSMGCSKKPFECQSLVKAINPSMEKLNALGNKKDDANSTADIKEMASVLDATAVALAKLDLSTPELKKRSQDYQAMCKETSESFKQMIALVASMEAGGKKMEGLGKTTEGNMTMFKQLCTKGKVPAECRPIGKKLQQIPDNPDNVAVLDKFIGELGAIPVKNAAVKALMTDLTKNLTETAKLTKELKDSEKKVHATAEGLKKVTDRESAIIDGLNAFCGAK
jgi:hypothetical protein